MEGRLKVVGDAIAELDASRDALLAQLAQVEALLTQAHAERADLEESRSVFEEGVAFSLDALQHQVMHSRVRLRPSAFVYTFLCKFPGNAGWHFANAPSAFRRACFQYCALFNLVTHTAPEGFVPCPGG